MKAKVHFSILIGAVAVLSSCSNYGYISENDVYMQTPTEINLEENENDLTSYNAFKANKKGAFTQNYRDPRANETMRFNQMMIMSSYMPYGTMPGRYMNGPMAFHGMGYGQFYPYGFYTGHGMGLRAMYGSHYGYYDNFGPYGYGYNPYNPYYSNHYSYTNYGGYYGGGYYGGGYYNGNQNQTNPGSSQPVYYGNRSSISSSSNRSSSYPNTYQNKSAQTTKSAYDVNDQTLGSSRRGVQKSHAGSSDYSNSGQPNNSKAVTNTAGQVKGSGAVHQRTVNQVYTPSSSARRSGAVQTQRSVNVSGTSRGVSSSPSHRASPSPAQARPQVRGSFSTGGATGTAPRSTSSPSTTRSTGTTNSNSGRR